MVLQVVDLRSSNSTDLCKALNKLLKVLNERGEHVKDLQFPDSTTCMVVTETKTET